MLTDNLQLKNQVDNIQTIPGIGKLTAVAIIAESPDLESFSSARQLAAYAGLTPKHRTSGTSIRGKTSISKIGSSNLHKALYFPAIVAKTHNPLFKEFTQKLSSKGKPAKVVIVAICNRAELNPQLKSLDLSYNKLRDLGLTMIARYIGHLESLAKLNLANNYATELGLYFVNDALNFFGKPDDFHI